MRMARRNFVGAAGSLVAAAAMGEPPRPTGTKGAESVAWPGARVLDGGRRGYVDTPVGQVHYRSMGEGIPLLLLHESVAYLVQFAHVQPLFAAIGIRSVALDRPGHGLSDAPREAPSAEGFADNLPHVLDALGLDRVAVAGNHTGAAVAAAFTHRHPDRVSCLIMHGALLHTAEERQHALSLAPWNQRLRRDGTHLNDHFEHALVLSDGRSSLESAQWSTIAYFLSGERGWDGPRAAFGYDIEPAVREIIRPTLLISNTDGENADNLMAERILDLRSDFLYHKFEGGHFSHTSMIYDDPQPWVDVVAPFVRTHS